MKQLPILHNKKFELYGFEFHRVCVKCLVIMKLVVVSQLVIS